MEKLINDYVKYLHEIKNLSPKSIKVYIPRVKDMIKFCKFSTLNDIQNSTIIQLKYWLDSKKDYSNQYKNQIDLHSNHEPTVFSYQLAPIA